MHVVKIFMVFFFLWWYIKQVPTIDINQNFTRFYPIALFKHMILACSMIHNQTPFVKVKRILL